MKIFSFITNFNIGAVKELQNKYSFICTYLKKYSNKNRPSKKNNWKVLQNFFFYCIPSL